MGRMEEGKWRCYNSGVLESREPVLETPLPDPCPRCKETKLARVFFTEDDSCVYCYGCDEVVDPKVEEFLFRVGREIE
jgi:hypothetical protein